MNFKSFNFHDSVAAGVEATGYKIPTPIQVKAIPHILDKKDVMGMSQTGSGKTAAFVLPILNRLMGKKLGSIRGLVLSPTRELSEQIHNVIKELGQKTRVRSTSIYGGVGISPQIQKLKHTDIVVACPGRLLDHIRRNTIDFSQLEVLVIDEADQMFDMGFLPDIRRILNHLPQKRQTLFFSATMPREIQNLAKDVLKNPTIVQVGDPAPADTVRHALYPVASHLKTSLLLELLKTTAIESALVFTRTKHRAKNLGKKLTVAGYRSTSLQGNLSQKSRQTALEGFRDGTFQILVATDIAARGIDIAKVSHVINYDIPATAEAYIHRIGRTGRAANSGDAFTFITENDKDMAQAIGQTISTSVEQRTLEGFAYHMDELKTQKQRRHQPQRHQTRKTRPTQRAGGRDRKGAFKWMASKKSKKIDRENMPSAGEAIPVC